MSTSSRIRFSSLVLLLWITPLCIPKAATQIVFTRCDSLRRFGEDWMEVKRYPESYKSFKFYFENCAYVEGSWYSFLDMGQVNSQRSDDNHRFEEYREWLKMALYLNSDTNYYCADVYQIRGTLVWFNDLRGRDYKGMLAIAKFLVETKRCGYKYIDSLQIPATWKQLYFIWQDTVRDSSLTPFDSTLPSLEDLDLGILRGKPADVKKFLDAKYGQLISNILALENPFSSETKIAFTARETAAIHFEVFDILGKKVFDGGNKILDEGENQIVLPGASLPQGELYGRFSSSDGTVKTIKLRHIEQR
ncbi:MAG: hypothetical protein ABI778_02525 [Ignavibacteriota bacterium]